MSQSFHPSLKIKSDNVKSGEGRGEKKKEVFCWFIANILLFPSKWPSVSLFFSLFSLTRFFSLLLTAMCIHSDKWLTVLLVAMCTQLLYFFNFHPYFCICWEMLLLQRYWQKGASTLLLVVEKGNQWHWVDLTHFQLILPFLNISSLYIRCVMMSASLAPTKVSWLVNCWQFQIFRLLLRLCLCA